MNLFTCIIMQGRPGILRSFNSHPFPIMTSCDNKLCNIEGILLQRQWQGRLSPSELNSVFDQVDCK